MSGRRPRPSEEPRRRGALLRRRESSRLRLQGRPAGRAHLEAHPRGHPRAAAAPARPGRGGALKLAIGIAMVLALSTPASAAELVGTPRVVDGDTLEVDGTRVRLLGIDAPERGEPGSAEATSALLGIIAGREVTCTDTGGRTHRRVV